MSLVFHSRRSGSVSSLLLAAARQVLIAGAAIAGVLAMTGCSRSPAPAASTSTGSRPAIERDPAQPLGSKQPVGAYAGPVHPSIQQKSQVQFDEPRSVSSRPLASKPNRAEEPHYASDAELQKSRAESIADLINQATTPGAMPAYRRSSVLDEADRAVAPLTETIAAIDAGTRTIVENLRNADVPGYKVTRTAIGDGRDIASRIDTTPGSLQITERALDIAIQGEGFLPVRIYTEDKPDGDTAYTRNGVLYMNRTGDIVVGGNDGYALMPGVKFPPGVTQVTIGLDGRIQVLVAASDQPKEVGQIHLSTFADPTALRPLGGGLYTETPASGQALELLPGSRGAGRILQGQLEASNLDLLRERMRLKFLQNWRVGILSALEGSTRLEGR